MRKNKSSNKKFKTKINQGKEKLDSKVLIKKIIWITLAAVITSAISILILQYFQTNFDWEQTIDILFRSRTKLFLFQILIVSVPYILMISIIKSRIASSFIILLTSLIISVVNQQKILYRDEPFYPSDFSMFKEIPFLLGTIDKKIVVSSFIVIIAIILLTITFSYYKKKKTNNIDEKTNSKNKKIFNGMRIVVFILFSALLIYIYNFNQPNNLIKEGFDKNAVWTSFSQRKNYVENGFVAGFLYNLNAPAVEKPENYSEETIKAIVQKYKTIANEINKNRDGEIDEVNIIYVMSESFSDPKKIEGITMSKDPIPKTRKLLKDNLSGEIYSQGYGGGTANIEFEALTSISMEPMNPSITTPYIQLTDKMNDLPTIVSYLDKRGYSTAAMHPYQVSMYKRTDVYKQMGFDYFIHEANMENKNKIEKSPYISDESAYKEVLSHMAETPEKDFVHLVTMQNHGGYAGKYEQLDYKSTGLPNDEEAENYYQGLAYSDDSLSQFITEVSELTEKTMVVFWGDHLPGFYGDDISAKNGKLKMHSTPLIIYSNFKENKKDLETISPIYFMNHILKETNSSITPFYALTHELENLLPAFEKEFYLEKGSSESKTMRNMLSDDVLKILKEYDSIEYDITTGKNYLKDYDFFR